MSHYSAWRYFFIGFLVIFGLIYALPNFLGEDPAIQIAGKNGAVLSEQEKTQITLLLKEHQVTYTSIESQDKALLIRVPNATVQLQAQDVIKASLDNDRYNIALNLAPRTPEWLQKIGANPMKWGLDLRGGIHLLYDVDMKGLLQAQIGGDTRAMGEFLREKQIRYTELQNAIDQTQPSINVHFNDVDSRTAGLQALRKNFNRYQFSTLPEKADDYALKASMTESALLELEQYAIEKNMNTLRTRVNELGVSEAIVQQQGATHISVDLPGLQDMARAKEMVGKVATVRLQLVDTEHDAYAAQQSGVVPLGTTLYQWEGRPYLFKNDVILRGDSIINANTGMGEDGRAAVSIRLSGGGVAVFSRITSQNIGKPLGTIYVETRLQTEMVNGKPVVVQKQHEEIISVATIQSALGANFQITGLDSTQYANNLALLLRSGSFQTPVEIVQSSLIGPSLGEANIKMGVLSCELGSICVFIFMLFYYRLFGAVADLALLLNIVFILAIMSLLGMTLTLAGMAGIVLTVGMAVDANVLIYERIREELRNGMSPFASIHAGYQRAFATIVDANVSTLIVAIVLFALGTGTVKGFAVTLTVGLMTSMFTAIFVTRSIIHLIYSERGIKTLSIGIPNGPWQPSGKQKLSSAG